MRNNSAMTRMMTTYTRRPPGKNYVKTFFSAQLEKLAFMEDSIEINSIKVSIQLCYRSSYIKETITGKFSIEFWSAEPIFSIFLNLNVSSIAHTNFFL